MNSTLKDQNSNSDTKNFKVEISPDGKGEICRVIIEGEASYKTKEDAIRFFESIIAKVEKSQKYKFLVFCAGLLKFEWKDYNSTKDISPYKEDAENFIKNIFNDDLIEKFSKITEYMSFGIDSSQEEGNLKKPHVELVCLIDLTIKGNTQYHFTGKSYPIDKQEKQLICEDNLKHHFYDTEYGKVLLLVCNDLNIYNPRGKESQKREKYGDKLLEEIEAENPKIILHHAHYTDTSKTWNSSKNQITAKPDIYYYVSVGRYYNPPREHIATVLENTIKIK